MHSPHPFEAWSTGTELHPEIVLEFPAAWMLKKMKNMFLIVAKQTHLISMFLMRAANSVRAVNCSKIYPCAFKVPDFDLIVTASVIIMFHIAMKCIMRGKEKE